MSTPSSSLFFCFILFFGCFQLHQSLMLEKRRSGIALARSIIRNHMHTEEKKPVLTEISSLSQYIYPSYVNFKMPSQVQDCIYYEKLRLGFVQSISELQNITNVLKPMASSEIFDDVSDIAFDYLEFVDNSFLSISDTNQLIQQLQAQIALVNDTLSKDKCNYEVQWRNWNGTYMCASTAGAVDGKSSANKPCTNFKMYYVGGDSNRTYCIQSTFTKFFCTAEPNLGYPFTCSKNWCNEWEKFNTSNTRTNGSFQFLSQSQGTYLNFPQENLYPHVDGVAPNQYTTLIADFSY